MSFRLGFLVLLTTLCRPSNSQSGGSVVQQMVTFSNRMIPHLLQALSYDEDNVIYSPFGLATSLAMVMDGVGSKMATNISNVLRLEGPNARAQIRQGAQILFNHFLKHKNDEDSSGSYNRAHVYSSAPLLPEYQAILENYYKATVTNNISSSAKELILDIQTETGVMSHWKDFDKLAVYTYLSHQPAASFTTSKGTVVHVPMIPQVGSFKAGYIVKLSSQAVEIPLASKTASLVLIMSDYRDGIPDVLVKLLNENIGALTSRLPLTDAEISFPQFAIVSSDLNVGKVLKKSGLDFIFTTKRDGKVKKGPVRSIKQNAYFATSFVSVNSVASTSGILRKKISSDSIRAKRQTITANFVFNKPFLFFVMHKPTGLALLAGVVKTPTQVPHAHVKQYQPENVRDPSVQARSNPLESVEALVKITSATEVHDQSQVLTETVTQSGEDEDNSETTTTTSTIEDFGTTTETPYGTDWDYYTTVTEPNLSGLENQSW